MSASDDLLYPDMDESLFETIEDLRYRMKEQEEKMREVIQKVADRPPSPALPIRASPYQDRLFEEVRQRWEARSGDEPYPDMAALDQHIQFLALEVRDASIRARKIGYRVHPSMEVSLAWYDRNSQDDVREALLALATVALRAIWDLGLQEREVYDGKD